MNRGQAIDRINETLGFRVSLRSNIASHLQDVQTELENEISLPWFLQTTASLVTIASTGTVALPSNFLREYEDDGVWYLANDDSELRLIKDDGTFLRQSFLGKADIPSDGPPRAYTLEATQIRVFPIPDDVYSLRISMYGADDVLVSDSTVNKWLTYAHDLLIGMAGKRIAESLRDMNGIVIFTNKEAAARKKLKDATEARKHEGRKYVMGGDD